MLNGREGQIALISDSSGNICWNFLQILVALELIVRGCGKVSVDELITINIFIHQDLGGSLRSNYHI